MVAVKDADLKMDKAYIKIRSVETVKVKDTDANVKKSVKIWEREVPLVDIGAQTLEANQSYTWEAEVEIPNDKSPTYMGTHAWHKYEVFVGLDVAGNDPDTGWHQFTVK